MHDIKIDVYEYSSVYVFGNFEVNLALLLFRCYLRLSPFWVFLFSFFSSFNCFCFSLKNMKYEKIIFKILQF